MKKISISLSGHQTSISLESEFFEMLKKIAIAKNTSVAALIDHIDQNHEPNTNLSSAIRVWILQYLTQHQ